MPDKMRIALIGQAAFGAEVFKALKDAGEDIVVVSAPSDRDGRPDPLKSSAEAAGVPALDTKSLKTKDGAALYSQFQPDLAVMAFVTTIIPEEVLNAPSLGTIQYHPSLLPRHRGGSAINWAIIQGDAKTGLSIFWPDSGIDTGPILLQREVAITPDDTLTTLYFNKLFPLGVEAIGEAVKLIKDGRAPRVPQDEDQATYEPLCSEEHARIEWQRPAEEIYRLVRGANPQPGAWSMLHGNRLKIFDGELCPIAEASAHPGQIVDIDPGGISVAMDEAVLQIKRVQPSGAPKMAAWQYAVENSLRPGEMFES